MPKVKEVIERGDRREIESELAALLDKLGDGKGEITVWVAALYIGSLQKLSIEEVDRSVGRLLESSNRLEELTDSIVSLTRWLVRLTITWSYHRYRCCHEAFRKMKQTNAAQLILDYVAMCDQFGPLDFESFIDMWLDADTIARTEGNLDENERRQPMV